MAELPRSRPAPLLVWAWGALLDRGAIDALPERYKASASVFRGMWHEAGTRADLEQAPALLRAWLLDGKEVDDLPLRSVRREGIG
jgi:hypothetical protein